MAKNALVKTEDETKNPLALAVVKDELADIFGDDTSALSTGLEEVDSSDRKFPSYVWNYKGEDSDGKSVDQTNFFNTVTETQKPKLHLAVLGLHKSRAWSAFDGEKTVTHCRSWDSVTGTKSDGSTRSCKGCPDYAWSEQSNGKRGRNCGDIQNVYAEDLETGEVVRLRFRKTSLKPWGAYLNKNFLGKRKVAGGALTDYPLFAFRTEVTLGIEKSGTNRYAVPVFERGEVLAKADIVRHNESAKGLRELILRDGSAANEPSYDAEESASGGGIDKGLYVDGAVLKTADGAEIF
jgi:hypothetical protein